jgi:hypothetical protein
MLWLVICFRAQVTRALKLVLGHPLDTFQWVVGFNCLIAWALKHVVMGPESWHVLVDTMFQGVMLLGIETSIGPPPKHDIFWYWSTRGLRASKLTLNCLKTNDTFTTCR